MTDGDCDRCGNGIRGYDDPYLRNWQVDGDELCQSCMFQEVLMADLEEEHETYE